MAAKAKYKYVHGVQCPRCKEKIWSTYNHDFHYCGCGYTFVDGGKWYTRWGWGDKEELLGKTDTHGPPKPVKFRVPLKDWLESDRSEPKRKKWKDRFPY